MYKGNVVVVLVFCTVHNCTGFLSTN